MASMLRSVVASTRTVQGVVKDMGRLREVAVVLARHGFGAVLQRTPEVLRMGPLQAEPDALRLSLPQRVVRVLVELGPTFVKFGQIMSTRADLLPDEFLVELQSLQDRVPPVAFAEVRTQVEGALRRPLAEVFARFDEVPLASASIAQVHTAVLQDGQEVVVKVQRPGIRPTIDSDLSLLGFIARQAEEIAPDARMFNLVGMVEEFERSIARETDFTVEAASMERFARNFAGSDAVKIPAVHTALCTDVVLVMERIRGRKLTEATGDAEARKRAVRVYLDAAYRMIFHDGFFHGDLHPGNALLQDDGKLALLDFGMVGRLSQDMRDRLIDLVFAVLSEDMRTVARTFYNLGLPDRKLDYRAYEGDVIDVMERHFVGRSMADIQIGLFFRDLAEVAMHHRVRLPADYTMLFKALVTTEGLAKVIAPSLNPVEAARPYIEEALRERYSVERVKRALVADALDLSRVLRSLPGVAEHLLQDLERGEFTVRVDAADRLATSLERLARTRDRATVGLVSAACVVAFALMASEARDLINVPLLAAVLGFAGMAGVVFVVLRVWRE